MLDTDLHYFKQQFGIIGNASSLNRAIEVGIQVAPTDLTVLINGESGTGKESFSKLIHSLSVYKHGKFIAVNCGAIPEGTIDSELFGHEKGAFTGAIEVRKGYFEEANKGTIFLDEIGEMPLSTQTKLLRVLEYGEFIKVGSSKVEKIKVRVIAATNIDLLEAVYKGAFREDLYYRLNIVPIRIPPLRERGADIMILALKFATEFADQYYTQPIALTEEAQALLLQYRFPGNIRQLKHLIEQMSVLEVNRKIDKGTLEGYLPSEKQSLPALYRQTKSTSDALQLDFLYKLLQDMQQDIRDFRHLVFDFLNTTTYGKEIIKTHYNAMGKVTNFIDHKVQVTTPMYHYQPIDIHPEYGYLTPATNNTERDKKQEVRDVLPANLIESANLSIQAKEKELIITALQRVQQNRKQAAKELGISERTLYRKIKHYNLE